MPKKTENTKNDNFDDITGSRGDSHKITVIRLDKPHGSHIAVGYVDGPILPATEITIRFSNDQSKTFRVYGVSIEPAYTPNIVVRCRAVDTWHPPVILPVAKMSLRLLRYLCIGYWLREIALRKGRATAAFAVDCYILLWILYSVLVLSFCQRTIALSSLAVIVLVSAVYRVYELVVVYFNILLFDRIRAAESGETYVIVSSARSLFIAFVSYFEIVLCFALIYKCLGTPYFSPHGHFAGARDAIYFSMVTVTTLGYGDMKPLYAARLFAGCEAILGVIFGVAIIARMIGWLPSVRSIEK